MFTMSIAEAVRSPSVYEYMAKQLLEKDICPVPLGGGATPQSFPGLPCTYNHSQDINKVVKTVSIAAAAARLSSVNSASRDAASRRPPKYPTASSSGGSNTASSSAACSASCSLASSDSDSTSASRTGSKPGPMDALQPSKVDVNPAPLATASARPSNTRDPSPAIHSQQTTSSTKPNTCKPNWASHIVAVQPSFLAASSCSSLPAPPRPPPLTCLDRIRNFIAMKKADPNAFWLRKPLGADDVPPVRIIGFVIVSACAAPAS